MNNKKLRLVALVLVLAMTITASLAGCTKKPTDGLASGDYVMDPVLNPLGSETICKETVTLEFMMGKNGTVIDYDTNAFTKRLEEKGNVDIVFNLLASDDASAKINLTLSSGNDLPDVINAGLDDTTVTTYGEAGTFVVLNDYYANSSEYLMPRIEQYQEDYDVNLLDYITMSDGNIYSMAAFNESIHNNFPYVIWIYEPWVKKVGMKLPTTLDEYVECLKAFRDKDPNGNGRKDELPVIDYSRPFNTDGFMKVFLQAFIKTGVNHIALKDGEIVMDYTTDEYKEFLKWMRMLYSEGLLDKTTFSQDNSTFKTLLNGATTRVGSFVHTSPSIITAGDKRRENYEYKPIFLKNGDESTINYTSSILPNQKYFITAACEHPEVAFRLGDFMSSTEMTIWTRWGEKGVDWKEPAADATSMYDFMGHGPLIEVITQWGSVQNGHWAQASPSFRTAEIAGGVVASDSSQQAKAEGLEMLYNEYGESLGVDVNDRVYKLINTADELEEISTITTVINSYVTSAQYKFITGEVDIDKGWDAYIKELKSSNVERLAELYQAAYDRMNDK